MSEQDKSAQEMEMENDPAAFSENGEESADVTEPPAEPTLEEQLAAAQKESEEHFKGWQRALADLSNARKRFEKQTQTAYTNATVDVIGKLLPVIDDFDRALENLPAEISENSWFEGLNGVIRKMNQILESMNAERIPAVGEPFDPNLHEALSMEPSEEYESGMVVRELQAGYRIGDRVVRPALVFVAE